MMVERNWLIRTSQNQILGPVAKSKLLEFIQKGALGMTDEVTSGNGYWFSLKEKDLVEKYLYGDVPQGYNPISESKSVLSNRANPDKTSSLNTAPANATQVIKLSDLAPGLAPKSEDLEFPDVQGLKLPTQDDLEFPDLDAVSNTTDPAFKYTVPDIKAAPPVKSREKTAEKIELPNNLEIVLPNEDDLAFPDMDDKTSTKVEKGKVDLAQQYTRTVALDNHQAVQVIPELHEKIQEKKSTEETPLSLERSSIKGHDKTDEEASTQKKERHITVGHAPAGDQKLLHDRRTKSSVKSAALRDPTREIAHKNVEQPEPLKKRNDNYIFFILIILILIIVAVFFYFKEILNKPLPV